MRWKLVTPLGYLLVLAAACGGRLDRSEGDAEDGGRSSAQGGSATSVGARSSSGGSANIGATTGQGGTNVGTAGKPSGGGSTSAGGACGTCPPVQCPAGSVLVITPEGCCLGCQLVTDCNLLPCPSIACASGFHLELAPGGCCPTCVADSCADQYRSYAETRDELVAKYQSLGCVDDEDCAVYYESNACSSSCGLALPVKAHADLDNNLRAVAARTCNPECAPLAKPCAPPPPAVCVRGGCQ
jgi:hypothetical protein